MKLAITSTGKKLDSNLDPRFGRAAYFIIVDPKTMAFEVVENSQNLNLPQGTGIQSAQFIADQGAKALITGHCGPNAMQTLSAAGVPVYVGQAGTVQDLVDKFNNGQLKPTTEANASAHAGTGGKGIGRGQGMGRGRGMGGRGMGGRGTGAGGAR